MTDELITNLGKAVKKACNAEKVGILFSGGVDSTLIAMLASRFTNVVAYSVGVENAPDLELLKQIEGKLDFKVIRVDISEKDVEENIAAVLKAVGEPSPVRVGAAFPPFFASRAAHKDGLEIMLSGQGADEIFGGYWRYLPVLHDGGYKDLEGLLKKDTVELKENLVKSDIAVCKANSIELRTPFLDEDFIDFALKIRVEEKIKTLEEKIDLPDGAIDEYGGKFYIRKYILKRAAERAGVPKESVWRPKKAAQYGSGVHKVLDRIARAKGFKEKAREAGRKEYLTMFLEDCFSNLPK